MCVLYTPEKTWFEIRAAITFWWVVNAVLVEMATLKRIRTFHVRVGEYRREDRFKYAAKRPQCKPLMRSPVSNCKSLGAFASLAFRTTERMIQSATG